MGAPLYIRSMEGGGAHYIHGSPLYIGPTWAPFVYIYSHYPPPVYKRVRRLPRIYNNSREEEKRCPLLHITTHLDTGLPARREVGALRVYWGYHGAKKKKGERAPLYIQNTKRRPPPYNTYPHHSTPHHTKPPILIRREGARPYYTRNHSNTPLTCA